MDRKEILRGLADNEVLFTALKELIAEKFSMDNISTNMNNEVIGQIVRANIEGKARVELAFKDIEQCKSPGTLPEKINPGK